MKVRFMRFILTVLAGLCMLLTVPLYAGVKYSRTVALPTFGGYFPPAIEKEGALSSPVAAQLHGWLRKTFPEGGQKRLEVRRSCMVSPSIGIDTEIRYSAIVAILVDHQAVDFFEFRIDLSEDGAVLNEPEIPHLDRDGLPVFASWETIKEAFGRAGFRDLSEGVYLDYSQKAKAAVWRAVRFEKATLGRKKVTTVSLFAENGKFLERTEGIAP